MTTQTTPLPLPAWAKSLVTLYESSTANQFILHGNINDRLLLPQGGTLELGTLHDFLLRVLLPRFDVVLCYDVGNGIHVEKGGQIFSQWPSVQDSAALPKTPRAAIETLTHYFRYCANLAQLGRGNTQVGCIIRDANMVAPSLTGSFIYDLDALTLLIRDWSTDSMLAGHTLATFLLCENLNDLHPLLAHNTHAATISVPLPSAEELARVLTVIAPQYPTALQEYAQAPVALAEQFTGASVHAVESLLKTKEYTHDPLVADDLVQLKKQLVEGECNGLIEFMESSRTLDDIEGQEKVKSWLRQDLALWRQNDLQAMPMGYLLCGPVGTGKTFMLECLAGEASVPIVKLKNFRDKWVGSTEGNLEKIFRLLHALGRCIVFIDEADQTLGKRDAGSGDSGLSGRVYSMMAEEMSQTKNRGKILWVLASSRPDLIEVDLKRPGRIDVKIPLFPTMTPEESYLLIRKLSARRNVTLPETPDAALRRRLPILLTPGAAEAIAVKLYRHIRTNPCAPEVALTDCLADYQNPVPPDILTAQMELAIREASDLDFVPPSLRPAPPTPVRRSRAKASEG
ncbi:MAG TPA: AAA family ATPase [Armatimonadota bacterium]